MKILFLTHYENMYGANRALFHLIRGLKCDYGQEPIIVLPSSGELMDELEKIGVRYEVSQITQWQAPYVLPLRFAIKKRKRLKLIQQELDHLTEVFKDEKIDVIHSNSSVIGTGAMLAERLGCKHVWHIREFSKEHFGMRYFYPAGRVRELYEKSEYLIGISNAVRDNYREKYPKANVIRIYDGVSLSAEELGNREDSFDSASVKDMSRGTDAGSGSAEKSSSTNAPMKFIYLGYLFPMKHQMDVVDACKQLVDEKFTNFEVYLAGGGKPDYKARMEKRISKYHLTQVHLTGYLENAQEFLQGMDAGIIASEYEGFGLVTVEYMLHGLPVIGRNSGGTPEIIEDGITGCLYDTTEELVNAMKYLMCNQERAKKMGQAGRERALKYFSEENNTRCMMELYKGIAENINT